MPSEYSDTNLWGYTGGLSATLCNTYTGTTDGDQITAVLTGSIVGGGQVFLSGTSLTQV